MKNYRVDNGKVYQYSKSHNAYIFCGTLQGRTLKQFIAQQEQGQ